VNHFGTVIKVPTEIPYKMADVTSKMARNGQDLNFEKAAYLALEMFLLTTKEL